MSSLLTVEQLQDLFLLYCNEGRGEKVVLGLTDTMYKKRLSTVGRLDTVSKAGFRQFLRDAGVVDLTVSPDYIFMQNLGSALSDSKKRFELNFEQFLDALAAVARAKYGAADSPDAIRFFIKHYVRPLFIAKFGEAALAGDAGAAGGGGGSAGSPSVVDDDDVVSVATGRSGSASGAAAAGGRVARQKRMSRVVLTTDGVAAAGAVVNGPKMGLALGVDRSGRTSVRMSTSIHASAGGGASAIAVGGGDGGSILSGVDGGAAGSAIGLVATPMSEGAPTFTVQAPAASSGAGGAGGSSTGGAARAAAYSLNPFSPEARAVSPARPFGQPTQAPPLDAAGGLGLGSPLASARSGSAASAPSFASPVAGGVPGAPPNSLASPALAASFFHADTRSPVSATAAAAAAAAAAGGGSSVGAPGATAGSGSPSAADVSELKYIARTLIAVVEDLRAELGRVKAENDHLRTELAAATARRL